MMTLIRSVAAVCGVDGCGWDDVNSALNVVRLLWHLYSNYRGLVLRYACDGTITLVWDEYTLPQDMDTNEQQEQLRHRLHLLYHELRPRGSAYSYVVDTEAFEEHLDLYVGLRQSRDSELWPEVTFDDGHISNYEFALPRLVARGLTARFFITAGWTGQRPGYMGWTELRAMVAAGQQIGGHGWSHTLLPHCDQQQLDMELRKTRLTLEEKLGVAVTTMSLPGGRYNRRVLAACREAGYTQVYTSEPRAELISSEEIVGRLNIRGDMSLEWLQKLFGTDSKVLQKLGQQYRWKETAKRMLGDSLYAKIWALANRQEKDASEATTE